MPISPLRSIALILGAAFLTVNLAGCITAQTNPTPSRPAGAQPSKISLSSAQANKIGRKIWQNECGGTVEGLTSWNDGEGFASLGIGHFIWYPPGKNGPFDESFPKLLAFYRANGIGLKGWLEPGSDCPWRTKAEFDRDRSSPRMRELRRLLADTVALQTEFIVARLQSALPKMQAAAPAADRQRVAANFYAVAESSQGVYALIDYVNFKGEGVLASERYNGQGWGLLQVLQEMRGAPRGAAAATEFSRASTRVLERRVRNSPPPRKESRWLAGWRNRCATYGRPF